MTGRPSPTDGVTRFIADLDEEGHNPSRYAETVRYTVTCVAGRYAGQEVETGVSISELQGWPSVPPHWIHLRDEVNFPQTNTDSQDCEPGWRRHSRDTGPWTMNRKPILTWISHVRGMLGQAV
ncbi:hypothetical protein FB561_6515 [Kribbella amoyensis]|uniref:Uncharacterized protein n=1 Tax=Kribbella amoyensis TaxID=996641 RepID=A0A561B8J6_9ACTN|nr:hypothetical protein [Kribbella amoyensis]TWD75078.1 hypothetical protein FB561_6515 [Kribbella amoyensis]